MSKEYFQSLAQELGQTPYSLQLIALVKYFFERAKQGEGISEDWGGGMKEARFVLDRPTINAYPYFEQLWGHKIVLILMDNDLLSHTFEETNFGRDY